MNHPAPPWPQTTVMTRSDDIHAPATQIIGDSEAYLGQGLRDVGRRVGDDQVELFVSGDAASALQRELQALAPEFVALHDIGTSGSLRLLAGLASAAKGRVQKLSVRRQGQGQALAVLQFVEVLLADGSMVRVYSTDVAADSQARQQMARTLLAFSRIGVLLVGELPPHALSAGLAPLQAAIAQGPWPNRDMLLVPLGSGTALAAQGLLLAGTSEVGVHVTPRASRPEQVWDYISGAWNRQQSRPDGERVLNSGIHQDLPAPATNDPPEEVDTEPMGLHDAAEAPPPSAIAPRMAPLLRQPLAVPLPMPVPGAVAWPDYVDRCALIKGVVSCCVFDLHLAQPLAHAGGLPTGERLAQQGAALMNAMAEATRALGVGTMPPEAGLTTASNHLLLRPVPGHPGIVLLVVLQTAHTNLTLARLQIERIEPPR